MPLKLGPWCVFQRFIYTCSLRTRTTGIRMLMILRINLCILMQQYKYTYWFGFFQMIGNVYRT